MTITAAFPNASKLEALQLLCPPGNTYKMALYPSTATLDKTATTYSAAGEVTGTGYTAGGKALTTYAASLSGDTAILDFDDVTWAGATITARGAVIYDSTNANKIRAVLDFGADITSTNGPFTVTLPAPAAATAIIRLA
jgi:hypothetical protein